MANNFKFSARVHLLPNNRSCVSFHIHSSDTRDSVLADPYANRALIRQWVKNNGKKTLPDMCWALNQMYEEKKITIIQFVSAALWMILEMSQMSKGKKPPKAFWKGIREYLLLNNACIREKHKLKKPDPDPKGGANTSQKEFRTRDILLSWYMFVFVTLIDDHAKEFKAISFQKGIVDMNEVYYVRNVMTYVPGLIHLVKDFRSVHEMTLLFWKLMQKKRMKCGNEECNADYLKEQYNMEIPPMALHELYPGNHSLRKQMAYIAYRWNKRKGEGKETKKGRKGRSTLKWKWCRKCKREIYCSRRCRRASRTTRFNQTAPTRS